MGLLAPYRTVGFPLGLRSEYRASVAGRLASPRSESNLTSADIAHLPEPLQRYIWYSGSIGKPVARSFRALLEGRIRGAESEQWTHFTAEQYDFLDEPARFFMLRARRGGLPIDVLHDYQAGQARMRVRVLTLIPVAHADGDAMGQAETVTLFNDACVFAPSSLAQRQFEWERVGDTSVRGWFTAGCRRVAAVLHFGPDGELTDFVSDDRYQVSGRREPIKCRWSTPLTEYRDFRGRRLATSGEGRWHSDAQSWAYIQLNITLVETNPAAP